MVLGFEDENVQGIRATRTLPKVVWVMESLDANIKFTFRVDYLMS